MEELTEVITAAEFHPYQCNTFVYSSSKGTIRLCDMRSSALCDKHSKREVLFHQPSGIELDWQPGAPGKKHVSAFFPALVFEEPEDPSNRSFFSEIISSISDVKFSHNGRYMMTRDYLSVKIWDLNMENRPVETYQVSQTSDRKPQKLHVAHHSHPLMAEASRSFRAEADVWRPPQCWL